MRVNIKTNNMKYRIIKHCWQGAYITDDMNYFTIEQQRVTIISCLKKIFLVSNTWHDWHTLKDNNNPIQFNAYMDAYHCVLRLMSGDGIGKKK
jgi:hypothetical protein